jgi:hypothetical protein
MTMWGQTFGVIPSEAKDLVQEIPRFARDDILGMQIK